MTLYESLLNCFGYNEPFKTSEINFEDYSKERSAFLDTLSGGSWNDFRSGKIK